MNDCEKYSELIGCLLDGELAEPQKTELEAHIALCPDCRRLYEAFALVSSALSEEKEPPESLREDVMSALREEYVPEAHAKKRGLGWGRLAALAACFALVIFAASKTGVFDRAGSASPPKALSEPNGDLENAQDERAFMSVQLFSDAPPDNTENVSGGIDDYTDKTAPTSAPTPAPEPTPGSAEKLPGEGDSNEIFISAQPPDDTRQNSGVSLMEVAAVTLYSGEAEAEDGAEREPLVIFADEESILLIMEMLEFSELADETLEVGGPPLFVADVSCRDPERSYSLSIWIIDGRLCCMSSLDDALYVAAGDIGDLIEFVLNA